MPYCKYCGKELMEEAKFCPYCGAPVEAAARPPVVEGKELQAKVRPAGVSVLAILEGLVSLFTLFGGIALVGVAAFLSAGGWGLIPEEELQKAIQRVPWASGFTGVRIMALTTAILAVIGVIVVLLAIMGFIMAWGLWTGKRWAWTITIVLSAIQILVGLFSLPGSMISILIYVAIIYYLSRPHVKAYYYG